MDEEKLEKHSAMSGYVKNDEEVSEHLTTWKNPPTVSDLQADLYAAEPAHSNHVSKVQDYLKNLDGKLKGKLPKNRSQVQPKLIRKQAEWRYAALSEPFLASNNLFNVDPRTYEDGNGAEDNEMLLNYQFNTKLNKISFIDEYIRTAVDEGTVVVQVGWKYEEEEREVEIDIEATPEQAQAVLYKAVQENRMSQEDAISKLQNGEPIVLGKRKVKKTVPKYNQPTLRVCEFDELVIDPTCEGDISKAQFIISPFETSISELKKDPSYKNLDKLLGKGEELIDADTADVTFLELFNDEINGSFDFKDAPRRKFTAYEYLGYWDIDKTGITKPIRAVYVGQTMIKLEELPFPDGKLPFVLVQYLPRRKSLYGEPDGALLEDNQAILGAVTRGMIDIMGRSANGQQGLQKGMLDATNMKKFQDGDDFFYNPGFDPRTSIHMQTYPEIPRSAMEMVQLQNMEAESMTGVKAFSQGISGNALGSTATGARGALDSASKRELGILRRLSKGIEEIGRKIVSMNAVFLSDEEVIRVTNKEFRTIKRDDLAGEYDLKLSISTPEADNQKAQELSFMLQTTAQSSDPAEVRMIRAEIARLRNMPELAQEIKTFQPQPDEFTQQKQQLELAVLQSEIAINKAKAQSYLHDTPIKQGKAQVETAKARNINSKSDQQDLDFLRKDRGVDHNEAMDKLEHSRLSNLDNKAFDAMATPNNGLPNLTTNGLASV